MLNKHLKKKIGVTQHVRSMGAKQEGMHVELEDGRGAQQGYKVLFSFWFVQNTSLVVGLERQAVFLGSWHNLPTP